MWLWECSIRSFVHSGDEVSFKNASCRLSLKNWREGYKKLTGRVLKMLESLSRSHRGMPAHSSRGKELVRTTMEVKGQPKGRKTVQKKKQQFL